MPRANRYFFPGYIWHITHRCHDRQFLLKFRSDQENYRRWLYEARKRHGLTLLNYTITSNHIHLLVQAPEQDDDRQVIARSMQLVAGRVGQEYNRRKRRRGAFWEDRYHATAVADDHHFMKCMVYIDLNMVRIGAVKDPADWPLCGLYENRHPHHRFRVIDEKVLLTLAGVRNMTELDEMRTHLAREKNTSG